MYTGKVFLIRHAHAVEVAPGLGDTGRWLTGKGRKTMREVGKRLESQGIGTIWTSPLVRAVQTAELLAGMLGLDDSVLAQAALGPGYNPPDVLRLLDEQGPKVGAVALVGHEPQLGQVAALLLQDPRFPGFRKCGVLGVSVRDGKARTELALRLRDGSRDGPEESARRPP
jgi:phosphohistidine phosphatase